LGSAVNHPQSFPHSRVAMYQGSRTPPNRSHSSVGMQPGTLPRPVLLRGESSNSARCSLRCGTRNDPKVRSHAGAWERQGAGQLEKPEKESRKTQGASDGHFRQLPQSPYSSSRCFSMRNPRLAATSVCSCSMVSFLNSSMLPHLVHTRWSWCSPSPTCS
jgi:hypothetical protein